MTLLSPSGTELPRELAAWRTTLSIFSPRLALILGSWLRRLAPVIGPLRVHRHETGAEPDGYHGLIRRGHYERLLTSEWLMAGEAPLEFLRRAAMGEHLFLHLVRRERRGALRSVALFDAGPSQLGTPRLAHLALLILLAERAMAAGAEFRWGVVQRPAEPLREDAGIESLRAFLGRRGPFEADPRHLEDWRRQLDEIDACDLWVIGSDNPELAGLSGSRVVVEDPLDPHRRTLEVRVESRSWSAVDLELDLPDAGACARLLRRPFDFAGRTSAAAALNPATGSAPVFSLNGHRLLVGTEGGGVVAYHIPRSANQPPGRTKSFLPPPGERLVAAGFAGRRLLAVTLKGQRLTIFGAGTAAQRRETNRFTVELPPDVDVTPLTRSDRMTRCHQVTLAGGGKAMVFVDREGAVFLARRGEASAWPTGVARIWQRVTAVAAVRDRVVAVVATADCDDCNDDRCVAILEGGKVVDQLEIDPGDGDLTARFGVGGDLAHPQVGLLAIRDREDSWTLIYGNSQRRLTPGRNTRVIGVGRSRQDGGAPALIIVDDDDRSLVLLGLRFARRIHRSTLPILGAVTSAAQPYLAYRQDDGEIVVLSLASHQPLVRIRPTPAAEGEGDGDGEGEGE